MKIKNVHYLIAVRSFWRD